MLAGVAMACLAGAAILFASAIAVGADRPVISGDPIVGHVLTSSPGPTGQALYKWQSCDPAVADCSDSPNHNDPDWTDLTGESHTGLTYTPASTDVGHFIRVLIHDNDLGDKWTTSVPVGPVTAEAFAPRAQPPAPEHGVHVLGEPVDGSVEVKLPGQKGYVSINGLTTIPVNSVIDTRGSRVRLIAATGDFRNTTPDQSVEFYGGLFRIQQAAATDALATAKLVEKLRCAKSNGGVAKAGKSSGGPVATISRKRRRRVWGSGSGSYGTAGSGGTGSVVGTTWLTQDTCNGTLFKVTEGIGITVFDFDLDKQVSLGPGQKYFAKDR